MKPISPAVGGSNYGHEILQYVQDLEDYLEEIQGIAIRYLEHFAAEEKPKSETAINRLECLIDIAKEGLEKIKR